MFKMFENGEIQTSAVLTVFEDEKEPWNNNSIMLVQVCDDANALFTKKDLTTS